MMMMMITMRRRRRRRHRRGSGSRVHDRIHHRIRTRRRTRRADWHPMTDASMPSIHPSIWVPTHVKKTPKTTHPNVVVRRPSSRVPETLMTTIHDSSFNTYTYIYVCILRRWDTRGVLYVCLVRIVNIRTTRSGRVFCSNGGGRGRRDEGGVASRVSRLAWGGRFGSRFLSVLGSVLGCLGDAFVPCTGVLRKNYPTTRTCVGGHGWMDGMEMGMGMGMGHGWNGLI